MGIGNQGIWDKGIGDPATQMLMQSAGQPAPSSGRNFGMALSGSNDPVQQPQTQQAPGGVGTVPQGGLQAGVRYHLVNGRYMTEEEYQQHLASGGQAASVSGEGISNNIPQEVRDMVNQWSRSRMGR